MLLYQCRNCQYYEPTTNPLVYRHDLQNVTRSVSQDDASSAQGLTRLCLVQGNGRRDSGPRDRPDVAALRDAVSTLVRVFLCSATLPVIRQRAELPAAHLHSSHTECVVVSLAHPQSSPSLSHELTASTQRGLFPRPGKAHRDENDLVLLLHTVRLLLLLFLSIDNTEG